MSFIKENGGPVALVVLGAAAILGYIELRLPSAAELQVMVDDKFVEAGAVPVHRMDSAEEDIEENAEDIDDFADRWNNLIDALAASRVER